jgi:hypothetical protein
MEVDMEGNFKPERWASWDAAVNHPAGVAKLRPAQIANRRTWGTVPDRDMTKAALHIIHTAPKDGFTVTYMNELDPGISEESVGEGTGWQVTPRSHGDVAVHGRGMR